MEDKMRVVAAYLGLAGCLACGSTTRNPAQDTNGGSSSVGGSAAAGTGSAVGGEGGMEPADPLQVPPGPMRRLTAFEYEATVEDVLGVPGVKPQIRGADAGGFDNSAELLALRVAEDAQVLLTTAEDVARVVFTDDVLRARLPACADASRVPGFVAELSLRLFRRPASEAELSPYRGVYDAAVARGVAHDAAVELVFVSLLFSSQFLFRMEPSLEGAAEAPADSYALATRLSYLLWNSAPDQPLLEAAAKDELQSDAGLSAAFDRLLADPRSHRFVESFGGQWLGLRYLESHPVSYDYFPWTLALANELTNEGYAFFEGFLRTEQPWSDFLRAPTPTPGPLRAQFYPPDGEPRFGFLSLPGWLALTSLDRRTSPTLRGMSLRMRLLCQPLPPPAADVSIGIDPPPQGFRELVESISEDEGCAGCHMLTDPLGLALEHYDFVGRYRTHYADNGDAVDPVIRLAPSDAYPSGLALGGLYDVSEYITTDPAFMPCLMEKLYTYGLGRVPIEGVDASNVPALAERWQEGPPTLRAALSTLVQSKPFRFRNAGGMP